LKYSKKLFLLDFVQQVLLSTELTENTGERPPEKGGSFDEKCLTLGGGWREKTVRRPNGSPGGTDTQRDGGEGGEKFRKDKSLRRPKTFRRLRHFLLSIPYLASDGGIQTGAEKLSSS